MNWKRFSLFGVLLVGIFLVANLSAQKQTYLLIELKYDQGNFIFINQTTYEGSYVNVSTSKDYSFKILDSLGNSLYELDFDPLRLYTDGGNTELEGGIVELNSSIIYLTIPDFDGAHKMIIEKDEILIFEREVEHEATSCRIA